MPLRPLKDRLSDIGETELGFSKEQARSEADRCLACECELCIQNCEFLKKFEMTSQALAKKFISGLFRERTEIPYSCSLCNLCEALCPVHIDMGKISKEARVILSEEGKGPLPQHQLVIRDQDYVSSDAFTLTYPTPGREKLQRAFFPGCSLSGYSPQLVARVYDYLKGRLPGTAIMLRCCGSPSDFIGVTDRFKRMQEEIEMAMNQLGVSELILACPDCYHTIRESMPHLNLRLIYEVILELGLPDEAKAKSSSAFSIHDSCKVRHYPNWFNSVRAIVKEMGYPLEELEFNQEKTRCCGAGGMVPYVDLKLALKTADRRLREASFTMLSYCATCRETFSFSGPSVHVLDLLFNPEWEKDQQKPPKTGQERRENQARLKQMILERGSQSGSA